MQTESKAPARRGVINGEFALRAASSAVLAPAALLVTWLEAPVLAGAVGAGGVILAREWTRMVDKDSDDTMFALTAGAAAGASVAASTGRIGLALGIVCVLALAAAIAGRRAGRALDYGLGAAYVAAPCAALIWLRLRGDVEGAQLVTLLFAAVWGADIGAYLAGKAFGGPRLAPRISPAKTVSGLIGGLVLAPILAGVAALLVGWPPGIWVAAGVGAGLGAAGLAGDLLESGLKRRYGVKDSGELIPGHGGLLDRVDGLMVASVVMAAAVLSGVL